VSLVELIPIAFLAAVLVGVLLRRETRLYERHMTRIAALADELDRGFSDSRR